MTTDASNDVARPGDDTVLPFQLDRADVRGRVARVDGALCEILGQHDYPLPVSALVAEAVLLTALIGQTIKMRWRLSLQIRGGGPIRLIATDYYAPTEENGPARLRAYAGFDADDLPDASAQPFDLLGDGYFAMVIDQGAGMTPYQGITPLAGGSLAGCAEIYFAQSEQIASRFTLAAALAEEPGAGGAWRAGGVMIQQLPESSANHRIDAPGGDEPTGAAGLLSGDDVAEMGDHAEDWRRAAMLMETAEVHELLGPHVTQEELLFRLFHEEAPRVFPAQKVRFGCTCSAERVEAAMAQYSAKDIAHMTNEDGKLTADCQFCNRHYVFDPETLGFERPT